MPSSLLFSFNHPVGACPECKGFGNTLRYDEELIIPDKSLSLSKGAIDPWNKPAYTWWKKQIVAGAKKSGIDVKKPFKEFNADEREKLFKGTADFYGIDAFFEAGGYKPCQVFSADTEALHACGERLSQEALAYKVAGAASLSYAGCRFQSHHDFLLISGFRLLKGTSQRNSSGR
jgi:excinuclease ABC subunit A